MTTQEILSRVHFALDEINHGLTPRGTLDKLREDLEAQVRNEIASSMGRGNAVKTIVGLLKPNQEHRPALGYPWVDEEGRQCVCDGFRAFRLREHLPLPERPDDAGKPIELGKLYPASLTGYKHLTMPSAKELREYIALERAKWQGRPKDFNAVWSFGDHEPSVNARYLLDAATVFPDAELHWLTLTSALVLTCEQGDGLLLPIRDQAKIQAAAQSEDERKAIEAENARIERNAAEARERTRAICQAHTDADAAWDAVKDARQKQAETLALEAQAQDDAAKAEYRRQYEDACEAEAKARLRHHAANLVFDPTASIEAGRFAEIIGKLYIRDHAA